MTAWSRRHQTWLETVTLPHPAQQVVFGEYRLAIDQLQQRIDRLNAEIADTAATSPHARLIAALQSLRGIGLVTAATLVAELDDITRFRTPRELMAYAGVVPSEYSTGARQFRGNITKTGNAHVRHVLVEAAWHYRHRPAVWGALRQRQRGQPERVKAIAWHAQDRLHRRYRRLVRRGKSSQQAVVAVARELLGFIWADGHGRVWLSGASSRGSMRSRLRPERALLDRGSSRRFPVMPSRPANISLIHRRCPGPSTARAPKKTIQPERAA